MNHSRHHAREVALQILYRYDVNLQESKGATLPSGPTLALDVAQHFDHFGVPQGVRQFAAELVVGTLSNSTQIDAEIEKFANNWKISRMALIDRNLIRMAYYEMSHFADIPHTVTIDEAVELAKQFGTAETSSFVNAILDSLRKSYTEQKGA